MTKSALFALALTLAPTTSLAQTFELTVKNGFIEAITGLSVSGGKVEAFKQVPAAGKRTFSVTLPDGTCEATISVSFADGQQLDGGKFDFCENDLFAVEF